MNKLTFKIIPHGKRSKEGMTLVEVLISLIILAVVLGGNAVLFAKCNVFAAELKEQSIVNNGLNERMEEVRNMSYLAIKALGSSCPTDGFDGLSNVTCDRVLEVPFANDEGRKVTLTVSWDSPQGRAMSKSLSAYFTNGGINKQ